MKANQTFPFLLILFISLFACKPEKKGFSSDDFFEMTNKSMAKTFEKAMKNPKAISSLNLSEKELEKIPDALDGRFVNLIQLVLRDNKIQEVPASIGKISKLKSLHLGKNQLTTLPASIGNLHQMSNLTLELNQINRLPDVALQFDRSATVDLRWNQLQTLPKSFAKSSIGQLYLSGNPITALPDNIGDMSTLKILWLADAKIAEIPESFYNLKQLTWLDVRGTQLSKEQVEYIKERLPECDIQSDFELKE